MKDFLLPFLLVLLNASLGYSQPAGQLVGGNNYRGVIFPADYKIQPLDTMRRWTPTAADILPLEQDLVVFMNKQPRKSLVHQTTYGPSIRKQLGRYIRQYAGYISPKGEKIIYVNCLWDKGATGFTQDWPTHFIQVLDGGTSYWRIYYDTVKRKFVGLSTNGVG
ncbi:hypothetical protein [Hymenobacter metallicola]|uniref:Uncharacterized protein n=1 Tax=Hymenobacter metallicola TaxID=2563114 RepID=A0A4Z0QHC9_9BACT|nr:hypothetical protein [Hymenobacter metallicola]TGE28092.1 hypothetical protein E5K02_01100 [Hymenobacter metallicola]